MTFSKFLSPRNDFAFKHIFGSEKHQDILIHFFKHAEETNEKELPQIVGSDVVIEQAYEALNRFSMTEEDLNSYEREIKREMDTVAVLLNAKLEGKAEERIEMAKKMLLAKVDEAVILQCAGFSKEELQKLKHR